MFSIDNIIGKSVDINAETDWLCVGMKPDEVSEDIEAIIGEPDEDSFLRRSMPTFEEAEKIEWDIRTLDDLPDFDPDETHDPTILFRNNWLAKGQSFIIVSSSGVGKSSMAVQMAYNWSIGKEFLASPIRPLKIAIIQSEDSDRDIQEQREGMRKGFLETCDWTEEDLRAAEKSIVIPRSFTGLVGDEFIKRLKEFQRRFHFDLIIINPLQAFFGGDVASQEDVSNFARKGLDPIMKDTEHGCSICLVCHTAKQKSGDKQGRSNVDDYGEYMMAGSHEWTDWARATFSFLKSEKAQGLFDFSASKRGHKLRWKTPSGERTTHKIFAHSDGYIFWREITSEEEIDEVRFGFDNAEVDGVCRNIVAWTKEHGPICSQSKNQACVKLLFSKFARSRQIALYAFDRIVKNPSRYGTHVASVRPKRSKHDIVYIGTEAALKERIRQVEAIGSAVEETTQDE